LALVSHAPIVMVFVTHNERLAVGLIAETEEAAWFADATLLTP
jgi:hypothetical protein